MIAYLDNSATTKVLDSVKDIMLKVMNEDYGNPSSLHLKGVDAEKYIKEAKENIARILKVKEGEIYFTSGGTESNNMALIGYAMANKRAGNHIITSGIEHASILSTAKFLEEQGFRVSYIPVDKDGVIDLAKLEAEVCDDTILVSVMHVNNEIGSIQPIEQIAKLVKAKNQVVKVHVDAIQSFGKLVIQPKKIGVDMLSVSGHKIHGPKGSGFLYIAEGVKVKPILNGGGQEKGMRSGTENVPAIAGLGVAAKENYTDFAGKQAKMIELKDYFIDRVNSIPNVKINSKKGEAGAPHIISVSFIGVRSEVMLHTLEEYDIFISAGSACSSNKKAHVSDTLKGIGLSNEELDSTVRFSLSYMTTREELDYCIDTVEKNIEMLRKYVRK